MTERKKKGSINGKGEKGERSVLIGTKKIKGKMKRGGPKWKKGTSVGGDQGFLNLWRRE